MKIRKLLRVKLRRLARPIRKRLMLAARLPLNSVERLVPYYFFIIVALNFVSLVAVGLSLWILKMGFGVSLGFNLLELVFVPVFMVTMGLILVSFGFAHKAWRLDAFASKESCIFCGYRARGLPLAGKIPGFYRCPECGELILTEPYTRPEEGEYLRKEAEEAVFRVKNYRKRHTMSVKTLKLLLFTSSFGAAALGSGAAFMVVLNRYYPGVIDTPAPIQPPNVFLVLIGTTVFGVPLFFLFPFMIIGAPLLFRTWHLRRLSPLLRKERTELFFEFEERVKRGVSLPKAPEKGMDQSGKKTAPGVGA